jgi:hypothetical protein
MTLAQIEEGTAVFIDANISFITSRTDQCSAAIFSCAASLAKFGV